MYLFVRVYVQPSDRRRGLVNGLTGLKLPYKENGRKRRYHAQGLLAIAIALISDQLSFEVQDQGSTAKCQHRLASAMFFLANSKHIKLLDSHLTNRIKFKRVTMSWSSNLLASP